MEALGERRIDLACVQETRWRGSSCRYFGATAKRYKLFWMGSEAKTDGVGIFVAEKWVDSVVSVERHSDRILVLKMVKTFSKRSPFTKCFHGICSSLRET